MIRRDQARAYLEVAAVARTDPQRPSDLNYNHVSAGVAVLAAIAASDAICCQLLGERSRGQDHREAATMLEAVRFGEGDEAARAKRAKDLANALRTVLDLKDQSHYGASLLGAAEVRRVLRATTKLVEAANELVR